MEFFSLNFYSFDAIEVCEVGVLIGGNFHFQSSFAEWVYYEIRASIMANKLAHKQCPQTDIENSPSPAACWHLENHTRRDQKLNAPALDEALAKYNKNEI